MRESQIVYTTQGIDKDDIGMTVVLDLDDDPYGNAFDEDELYPDDPYDDYNPFAPESASERWL